ncbi:BspA family leucine-rich repeat surface protein, partial [Paucilactobacillus hokkaidonensis]
MNKIQQRKRLRLLKDAGRLTQHYKMYKTSKGWLFAAVSLLTFSLGMGFSESNAQAADLTATTSDNSEVVSTSSTGVTSTANSVVLKSASITSSADSTVSDLNTVKNSSSSANSNEVTTADSNTNTSSSGTASANSNSAIPLQTSSSPDTSSTTSETNQYSNGESLVNPTNDEITAAKAAGAENYAITGTAQTISAVSDVAATGDATPVADTVNFWTPGSDVNANSNTGTYGDNGLTNYVYTDDPFTTTVDGTVDTVSKMQVLAKGIYGSVKWYVSTDGILHLGAGKPIGSSSSLALPIGNISPWVQYQNLFTRISIDGEISLTGGVAGGANYLFASLTKITAITGADKLDFTGTTDVTGMFSNTTLLTTITGSSSWNLSKVRSVSSMFVNSGIKSLDVSNWGMNSITSAASMFNGAKNLTQIIGIENWSMASATNLVYMFNGATSLSSLNFSGWNTSKVTNMTQMLYGMTALKQVTFGTGFVTTLVAGGTVALPNTTDTAKWVNVGIGTTTAPQANLSLSTYAGKAADTYVLRTIISVILSSPTITYNGKNASEATGLTANVDGVVVPLGSDDVAVTDDAANVNDYGYTLTSAGIEKVLATLGAGYVLPAANVTAGVITISSAAATVTLSGSENNDYTGKQQSPTASHYQVTLPDGTVYTLT